FSEPRLHQPERGAAAGHGIARADRVDDDPADDEDERPPDWDQIEIGSDDPQRELDDAVAGDIEQCAEQAGLVALAGDIAVEPVGNEDQDDQKEAREMPCAHRLVSQPDDQNQKDQPAQRDEVGHAAIIRMRLPTPSVATGAYRM